MTEHQKKLTAIAFLESEIVNENDEGGAKEVIDIYKEMIDDINANGSLSEYGINGYYARIIEVTNSDQYFDHYEEMDSLIGGLVKNTMTNLFLN